MRRELLILTDVQREYNREEVCFEKDREKKKQGRMEVGKYLESYEFAERSAQVWV